MFAVMAMSYDWDTAKLIGVYDNLGDAKTMTEKINQCTYTSAWIQEATLNPVLADHVTIFTLQILDGDFANPLRNSYKTILELEEPPEVPKIQKIGMNNWILSSQNPAELDTLLKEAKESV